MTLAIRTMRPVSRSSLPRRIRGLGLWLDASVRSSLTFNGDGVSEWRDLSGRGRHFTQATAASQPNGTSRTYNGLRVLDFDGTQYLEGNAATLNLARNVPGLTVLLVGKFDSAVGAGSAQRFFSVSVGGDVLSRASIFQNVNGIVLRGRRLDSDAFAYAIYDPGSSVRDANVYSSVIDYENAEARIFSGGTLRDTNAAFQTPGATQDTDSNVFLLGAFEPSLLQGLNGFVAELLVYRRVLSDLERSRLEQHLIRKWNPQPEPAVAARSLWLEEISDPVYHWSV
jgi:hypothetical protein